MLDLVIGVVVMGAVTFATRATPFVLFRKHQPGPRFMRIQEVLPPLILGILLVYAAKDPVMDSSRGAAATFASLTLVFVLHRVWRNPLVSIFGGTGAYLALQAWLPVLGMG